MVNIFSSNFCFFDRMGLLSASGTKFQVNGAAYGKGIYLSPNISTSMGYSRMGHGTQNLKKSGIEEARETRFLQSANITCIALCEVIKAPNLKKNNSIWVCPDPDLVCTRFFFVYEDGTVGDSAVDTQKDKYIQEIQSACDYKMWIHVCARVYTGDSVCLWLQDVNTCMHMYIQEIQSACDYKMWIHVCARVYTGDSVCLWLQDVNTCMCTCIYRRFSLLVITRCEYMYVHVYIQEIQSACDYKMWIHVCARVYTGDSVCLWLQDVNTCMYTCIYRRFSLLVITRCEYMYVHVYIQEIQSACDYKMWIHVCARVYTGDSVCLWLQDVNTCMYMYIQEIQSACDYKMWIHVHVCACVYTGDSVCLWLQDVNTCICTCIYRRFSLLVITRCEYM